MKKHKQQTNRLEKMSSFFGSENVSGLYYMLYKYTTVMIFVLTSAITGFAADTTELIPVSMKNFYIVPGTTTELQFIVKGNFDKSAIEYKVLDYSGMEKGTGKLNWNKQRCTYVAELTLKTGFYEINVPSSAQRFGVVSLPAYKKEKDNFFALETLLEELIKKKSLHYKKTISDSLDILKKYGISSIREYTPWQYLEKNRGKFNQSREVLYQTLENKDIKALFFFSACPEWSGSINNRSSSKYQPYPQKLLELTTSIAAMIKQRSSVLDAFQIWNEPDLKPFPADTVMPLIELASWTMHRQQIKLPLVGPGFSGWNSSSEMINRYLSSGLLDYIDIFALHTYKDPEDMISLIEDFRYAMQSHPKGAMPIWMTESGKSWDTGLNNVRTMYGGKQGKKRGSIKDDTTSAMSICMKAVEAKAGGIAKYFPFTYIFFKENRNNFGMTDFYMTPMRSIAAYFNCIRELSGKDYIGDLTLSPPELVRTRIFSDNNTVVAVLYTAKPGTVKVNLSQIPAKEIRTIDGSSLKADAQGYIMIKGGIAYATLNARELEGKINSTTKAMQLLKLAKSYKAIPRKSSPVIFQFTHWKLSNKDSKYYIDNFNAISVNVVNLSKDTQIINPKLILPPGIKIISTNNKSNKLLLKPESIRTLNWSLDHKENKTATAQITLEDENGLAAPITLPFLRVDKARNNTFEFNLASRWKGNSSGKISITQEKDGKAIKFKVDFSNTKGDYWVYPEYDLKLPEESLKDAVAISFEIKTKQKNKSRMEHCLFMICPDRSSYTGIKYSSPEEEWQNRIIILPLDKRKEAKLLRIGMNPVDDSLEFQIRNMKVHYEH